MLENKVAVVTGASGGIGRAIAEELARNGAAVIVNYYRSEESAKEVVAAIDSAGGKALAIQADVSEFDAAQAMIKLVLDSYGQIDILVNNAGTTRDKLLLMMKEDDWDVVMDTNLKSLFNCCKAVARPMIRRKQGGRIINISSISGLVGQGGQTNYASSKAGMVGFTKSLAKELGSRSITVNAVAPGFVPTTLTANLPAELIDKMLELTPLGRLGDPEEVAHLVTFLASDKAAYITGEVIRVDGGLAM